MGCRNDEWLCQALQRLGLRGFAGRTVEFLLSGPLRILLILLVGLVVSRVGARLAARSVRSLATRSPLREMSPRAETRAETLSGVAASGVRIAVWAVVGLLVINEVGVQLGPILAGASIVGVALGFGAQSLVKDFLSGFFILAEDQYGVGDAVTVAGATGTVEEVNLRVTRLRGADGTVWFVPNGEIRKVGNSAKEWSRALVDVVVPSDADVTAVSAAIGDEAKALAGEKPWSEAVLEPPEVLGVESLGADGTTLRLSVKTVPKEKAALARQLRARIAERLRREGVATVTEPAVASTPKAGDGSSAEG